MKKLKEKHYRVWIELDKPVDDEHAAELCAMANKMMARLIEPSEPTGKFAWSSHTQMYMYGENTYTYLKDRGEWFNLKYFGRDD